MPKPGTPARGGSPWPSRQVKGCWRLLWLQHDLQPLAGDLPGRGHWQEQACPSATCWGRRRSLGPPLTPPKAVPSVSSLRAL